MSESDELEQLCSLSARLIDELDKLAEVARVLALRATEHERRSGELSHPELRTLLGVLEMSAQQTKLLRDGMELLGNRLRAMGEEKSCRRKH